MNSDRALFGEKPWPVVGRMDYGNGRCLVFENPYTDALRWRPKWLMLRCDR